MLLYRLGTVSVNRLGRFYPAHAQKKRPPGGGLTGAVLQCTASHSSRAKARTTSWVVVRWGMSTVV